MRALVVAGLALLTGCTAAPVTPSGATAAGKGSTAGASGAARSEAVERIARAAMAEFHLRALLVRHHRRPGNLHARVR